MKKTLIICVISVTVVILGIFPASYHIYNYKIAPARYVYWKELKEVWYVAVYTPRECWSGYINGNESYGLLKEIGSVLGFFSSVYFDFKYKYLIDKIDSRTPDGLKILNDLNSVYPEDVAYLSFDKVGGDITQWQELSRGASVVVIPWPKANVVK